MHRQQAQITRLLEEIAGIRAAASLAADVTVDRQPDVSIGRLPGAGAR